MSNFEQKYTRLNAAQKKAVDTIEGPVMVIAGPGTGKTELLSMRVANILRQTDSAPENILCLTFTESGASAMRERLINLIGKDAHHVAIHTFHSFGSETINTYGDFFYRGAQFQPAHELTTHHILETILKKLPHDSSLASQMNGEFTQLKNIQNTISDFKKSGLTADEIQAIIAHNTQFIDYAEPLLADFFDRSIHKIMLDELTTLRESINKYKEAPLTIPAILSLYETFLHQLTHLEKTAEKTTPITAWRNLWLEKNERGAFVFKDRKRYKKLLEASHVYWDYLAAMQEAEVYDYNDMILRVVHALEIFPELRYNLQEKYQYILVDEFQDTNGAQLRILLSLTDSPANEGRPNLLIVGDDDQAIYSFQGAEISNILTLQHRLSEPVIVPLVDNYRSAKVILDHARNVITQGQERLESVVKNLDKTPVPHAVFAQSLVELHETPSYEAELSWIATIIDHKIKQGIAPGSIAVLARNHRHIQELLPYLAQKSIAYEYEHKENILEQEPIKALLLITTILVSLQKGAVDEANELIPELLAHPMWGLPPTALWEISLAAHRSHKTWIDTLLSYDNSTAQYHIAEWLVTLAQQSMSLPLDSTLDHIIGTETTILDSGSFVSSLRTHYFSEDSLENNSAKFLGYLESIRYLRSAVHEYVSSNEPTLSDIVSFVALSRSAHIRLSIPASTLTEDPNSVQIMTAHKSKGLEFDTVFILNACDSVWGSKSRGFSTRLSYPLNMAIAPVGESEDEKLRLFFVAMTRAKKELYISYAVQDTRHKKTLKAHFLENDTWQVKPTQSSTNTLDQSELLHWKKTVSRPDESLATTLKPLLKTYALSATHLNNFIDVSQGGPRYFLLQNLLHFPQAMPPAATLGSAIHCVLKIAQEHYNTHNKKRPVEDLVYDFEAYLKKQQLSQHDHEQQLQKGTDILHTFLPSFLDSLSREDFPERDFRPQHVTIDNARLTGIIDLMHVDHDTKTIVVKDYKTGTPSSSWQGKTDYEKIKLHKYKQQLLFYKLLIENSRDFHNYIVEKGEIIFVQPDQSGTIHTLDYSFEKDEIYTFRQLIAVVWRRILGTDFIDTTEFDASYKGILAFEEYLLDT